MSLQISGHTGLLGFFADPASHSRSPLMYNTAFEKLGMDYVYLAFQIDRTTLPDAIQSMRTFRMRGANVSMPNKTAVMQYLDEISTEARLCGAVNTIVNDDGHLTGYNTDGSGAMLALSEAGVSVSGKHLVILGAGGAGTAIITQAALDGVSEISVFVRKSSFWKSEAFLEKIQKETGCQISLLDIGDPDALKQELTRADILINATSIGMEPDINACPVPGPEFLNERLFVMDIIYSPEETTLLRYAKAKGLPCCNGLGMLLYQGAAAFRLYTGEELPIEDVKKAWGVETI